MDIVWTCFPDESGGKSYANRPLYLLRVYEMPRSADSYTACFLGIRSSVGTDLDFVFKFLV